MLPPRLPLCSRRIDDGKELAAAAAAAATIAARRSSNGKEEGPAARGWSGVVWEASQWPRRMGSTKDLPAEQTESVATMLRRRREQWRGGRTGFLEPMTTTGGVSGGLACRGKGITASNKAYKTQACNPPLTWRTKAREIAEGEN